MHCELCHLCNSARHICVPSRGSEEPIIQFVGEAPGRNEDAEGITFVGKSGQKLDELIRLSGIDPSWCSWANIVRCIPWNDHGDGVRPPEDDEIDSCCHYLEKEIMKRKPVVIIPLGATATYYFLGDKRISKLRGRRHSVKLPTLRYRYARMLAIYKSGSYSVDVTHIKNKEDAIAEAVKKYGYKDVPTEAYTIFPTYHPAAILYGNQQAEADILSDLNFISSSLQGKEVEGSYIALMTLDSITQFVDEAVARYLAGEFKYMALDIETSQLNPFDSEGIITTIGFSYKKGTGVSIPLDHRESPFKGDGLALKAVKGLINCMLEIIPVVGHNIKFDYRWCYTRGIFIKKVYNDTELTAWTLFNDQSAHDLETLTSRYTDLALHKHEMKEAADALPSGEKHNTDNYALELITKYNAADCDATLRLCESFDKSLIEENLEEPHQLITVPAILPTCEMELNGCVLDTPFLEKLQSDMELEMAEYMHRLESWGVKGVIEGLINNKGVIDIGDSEEKPYNPKYKSFKLGSTEQKAMILYDILEFEPTKYGKVRSTGKLKGRRAPSTDKTVILELLETANEELHKYSNDPNSLDYQTWKFRFDVIKTLQDYSLVSKMYSAYAKGLPKKMCPDGFVRPDYGIRRTATGRYNCRNPSLHVIPWHSVIKQAFISRFKNGVMLSADESQMELRVLAMVTQDEGLVKAFTEGKDLHRMVASKVLHIPEDQVPEADRRRIKTVNFGIVYERGAKSIAAQEGIPVEEAQRLIDGVMTEFPGIMKLIQASHKYVHENGFITYINGFRRIIPMDPQDPKKQERQSVNSQIQGTASDLGLSSLVIAQEMLHKLKFNAKLYQFVHDSIGYDVPPGEAFDLAILLKKAMEQMPSRKFSFVTVPLKVDFEIGISWGHLIQMKLLEGRKVKLEGKELFFQLLMDRMSQWDDAPNLIDYKTEVKKEPKVVRSLLRTTESEEFIDVPYITAELEFPPFVRRAPEYTRVPMFS